jgi:riboflavin synthase
MFTGIITSVGTILEVEESSDVKARIGHDYDSELINIGASIAHDGICLTVTDKGATKTQNWYTIDISKETLSKTNINTQSGKWTTGKGINLEKSLKVGDELGGHIVTGHIDGVANVIKCQSQGSSTKLVFQSSNELSVFIANKGSIALNGTSLTVNDVNKNYFSVNLIPHTKNNTTWGTVKEGDIVNLEVDTLARYVARLKEMRD